MTPEQHNKFLGIAHLVYGGLYTFLWGAMAIFFATMMGLAASAPPSRGDAPPFIFLAMILGLVFGLNLLFTAPSLVAGWALLKRRRWAKIAAIIAGATSAMSVPFGTAVCVYTFWFLFSEPGKQLYDKPANDFAPQPRGSLHEQPASFGAD